MSLSLALGAGATRPDRVEALHGVRGVGLGVGSVQPRTLPLNSSRRL
jgi:hypothetical protein